MDGQVQVCGIKESYFVYLGRYICKKNYQKRVPGTHAIEVKLVLLYEVTIKLKINSLYSPVI